MTTIYKDELFDRLYNYLSNYDKFDPTTYKGFLTLPTTRIVMNHYDNDPYKAALGILHNTGKFTKDEIFELDGQIRGWWGKLTSKANNFINNIINNKHNDSFIEGCKEILDVATYEYYPLAETPIDVPDYVTNAYLENAPELFHAELNKYLNSTGEHITPDNVYDLLNKAIANTKNNLEAEKQRYLNLTSTEFFKQCVDDPDLLNRIARINDPEFVQLMNAKFNQGQLEHLTKHSITDASKTETMDDLYGVCYLQSGVDEMPLKDKLPDYLKPVNKPNLNVEDLIYKQPEYITPTHNLKNIIVESLQNTTDINQIKLESEPINIPQSNSELWKILAGAGGIALLGGGAYAGYRWWQNRKLQQELEKQREQELNELKKQVHDGINKSRQRRTVINNIVHTKPFDDEAFNI